jgi:hypothetical protein
MSPSDSEPSIGEIVSANKEGLLYVHLNEYIKLKDEQIQRMRFRDNLLYMTLVAFGGIMSYAVTEPSRYYAFLVLPWVCLILGWTYLVNDEKISAIGRYIREELSDKIEKLTSTEKNSLFGWEVAHRSDKRRVSRKIFQLIVDETTFVISGLVALGFFWFLVPEPVISVRLLWSAEAVLVCSLGLWIFVYADLKKGR